ncbi:fibrinogen-like protein 1 [Mytilus californianus]|uniref:fibrinogen-like protein 1 n=1 Tax=Mytilus californianus TaxID=6549 RepID=UPI0022476553|nr:fibrinogen-like protein 1 [Mytilus californianus]
MHASVTKIVHKALTCFDCQNISHPRFCEQVRKCKENQICGLEREVKSNGDILFNVGCMTPEVCDTSSVGVGTNQPCLSCCSTDLCNTNGCGEHDHTKNGTLCYACSGQQRPESCHTVSFCESFEMCYLEEKSYFGEKFYNSGCKVKHICDAEYNKPIVGRRSIKQSRSTSQLSCCDKNLCNDIDRLHGQVQSTIQTTNVHIPNSSTRTTTLSSGQPSECADIASDRDGVYTIIPKGSSQEISVFCIMRGGNKWTVIQRRINGKEDFYRTWSDYKSGFGTVQTEYWLGNDNVHFISANGDHNLSVYVEDFNGLHAYANYSHFAIGDESTKYLLDINGYFGDAGDGLSDGNAMKFSTKNSDNDISSSHCAVDRHAGWWFRNCDYANLNGKYNDTNSAGNYWYRWKQNTKPLKKSIMMIKRK